MMSRTLLVAVALVATSVMANAQSFIDDITGVELLAQCEAWERNNFSSLLLPNQAGLQANQCSGYLHGFAVGYGLGLYASAAACPHDTMLLQEYALLFTRYLKQYPEKLHLNAGELLLQALAEAFPCPE